MCNILLLHFFNGIPNANRNSITERPFFITVLPIMLYFTFLDYKKMGVLEGDLKKLDSTDLKKTVKASLIRNTIKFLPWQLGHMGTIHGVYSNFDLLSIILSFLATLFAVLLMSDDFRKDKRHLGDLLAQTGTANR